MERPFFEKEVKAAVWDLEGDKALGPRLGWFPYSFLHNMLGSGERGFEGF